MQLAKLDHLRAKCQSSTLILPLCSFVATILYCCIAEHSPLFRTSAKSADSKTFLVCIAVTVLLTLKTWTGLHKYPIARSIVTTTEALLPRKQTEEWKGWMQAVILLYHYFGLSNHLPIYQVMRVLVAAYIFLTGYSHTSYFLKTNDFSLTRTAKTLLRLNLLSGTLAFVMNKSCDFYYFPMLTSFWYLVILTTLVCARICAGETSLRSILICLVFSCGLVQFMLYSDSGRSISALLLSQVSKVGGPQIDPQEFMFRLKLDSIVPYWGALLAVWSHHAEKEYIASTLSQCRHPVVSIFAVSHISWYAMAAITSYFLAIQQFKDKFASNVWHPMTSIVPIAAMLVLRNASASRRQGFNAAFTWLGAISLETYVLQSHIWLTSNNKKLLNLAISERIVTKVPGLISIPTCWLETVVLSVLFMAVSYTTAQASRSLVEHLTTSSTKTLCFLLLICWLLNLHWGRFS